MISLDWPFIFVHISSMFLSYRCPDFEKSYCVLDHSIHSNGTKTKLWNVLEGVVGLSTNLYLTFYYEDEVEPPSLTQANLYYQVQILVAWSTRQLTKNNKLYALLSIWRRKPGFYILHHILVFTVSPPRTQQSSVRITVSNPYIQTRQYCVVLIKHKYNILILTNMLKFNQHSMYFIPLYLPDNKYSQTPFKHSRPFNVTNKGTFVMDFKFLTRTELHKSCTLNVVSFRGGLSRK